MTEIITALVLSIIIGVGFFVVILAISTPEAIRRIITEVLWEEIELNNLKATEHEEAFIAT